LGPRQEKKKRGLKLDRRPRGTDGTVSSLAWEDEEKGKIGYPEERKEE